MRAKYGLTRMGHRRFWELPQAYETQARHGLKRLTEKQRRERENWDFFGADNTEGLVYFIQREGGGPIKIGQTTWLSKRLSEFQVANPERLKVLRAVPVNVSDLHVVEKMLHNRFSDARVSGEWFLPVQGIWDLIDDDDEVSSLSEVTLYMRSSGASTLDEED